MKTLKLAAFLAALTCLGPAGSYAADSDYRSPGTPTPTYRITGTPTKLNKASGLIGTEVRNQSDEKLGSIKDMVIDLNSGKVSYVVLDTGGILKTKLFAVPLSAFRTSSDQNHLILNADKKKMEAAKGFESEMWPNVSEPVWGAERFWEQHPVTPPQDRPQERTPLGNPPGKN